MTQQVTKSEVVGQKYRSRLGFVGTRASSAARILLAVIFLLSGIAKVLSPGIASSFVAGILPMTSDAARIIVIPLSLLELGGACLLLLKKWVTAVVLTSSFFFLSASVLGLFLLGEDRPCGCFGDLFLSQTDEWFLIRSLALLFLSLFVLRMNVRQSITGIPNKP